MKIPVKNFENKTVRELDLPDEVFAYPYKEHLIHTVVQAYLAGNRAGTHKTKVRSEVAGSGKKLWKQKGTGRARVGSVRSPIWRHGGTVHGPVPRDYGKDVSAREKRNALRSALARKLKDSQIIVLESLDVPSHKTRDLVSLLSLVGAEGKVLVVDRIDNENLVLAGRNNPTVKTVDARGVQVYDVIDRPWLVFSEQALGRLVEVLAR
ncbi:MAG: 50S ribosomal protein L4 [Thermoanaerobaculia bacterium]|nr:MAG: 50S ribosomal protein L4 [Thermoanaerobaculia bacterium]MBZ0101316.1 50S ribosomal protein L4 [Thermoanaerobaculia bacterium]